MNNEKVAMVLKNIKEKILNKSFSHKTISIALSVWILSLTAYYCIYALLPSFLSSGQPDTKQLIAETLKFNWIPIFLSRLPYVFYVLLLNFIALLMGNRILRWLKVDFSRGGVTPPLPSLIFSIPLGWSVYSIGIFYLGVAGLLYKEAVYLFLTLLGILSILEIKNVGATLAVAQNGAGARPAPTFSHFRLFASLPYKIDKTDLVFLPVIIIFLAIQLVTAFSPVWSGDAMAYHIALPKLYIKHHSLVHVPGFFFSTLPAHTEMLYLLGLITSGETLSKLFSFSISSVFLISIFSIGIHPCPLFQEGKKGCVSKGAGYLSAVIMILSTLFFPQLFSEPFVDTAIGLFSLLGVYAFFMWTEERKDGYLYLSSICCALAAATKIHGLFFVILFFVGFLVTVKMNKYFLKKLAWCILAVCVIALPWYIRSWWLTGNPAFPLFYNYLGGKYWNEYSNACFWKLHSLPQYAGTKSFSDFIRINKNLFFSSIHAFSFSPVIVIFMMPALITLRNWNGLIRYLFFITLGLYIFFIFTCPEPRYFYVGLAMLGIIIAHFIKTVWTKYLLTRIPIILCIVVFSIASFSTFGRDLEGPFFAGLGVLDQRQFHANNYYGHYYKACMWVNENTPQDSKILTWHWNVYQLEREWMVVNPARQGIPNFGIINDAQTFLKTIKELGITHLVYRSPNWEHLDKHVLELFKSGDIILVKNIDNICAVYSVNPKNRH